ncbi:fungal-specific transcription factor domain-containing protein [Mycena capillaripes]|nr:fungal-specific transcription factor domain-containing protein [Mycena capillaripes]
MEPPPTTGLLYFSITDADESTIPAAPGSKRRRLRGTCNHCRQRKIRCDSATKPGNICSNCIAFNSQCTHNGLGYSKKGSPDLDSSRSPSGSTSMPFPDSDAYNEKTAPEHVDTILIQSTAYIAARDLRNILLDVARYARELEQELEKYKSQFVSSRGSSTALESTPSPAANADFSDDNSQTVVDSSPDGIMVLCDDFQDMNIVNATRSVFFGRSSGFYLIQTAQELRAEHDGPDVQQPKPTRREEFWHSPWEITPLPPAPAYKFPPQDLLGDLISIFFDRVNIILSCLHRPTFERSVASGLHLIDHSFGSLVLALCSLASRYSDDPRVVLEGTNSKLSSGWEWFRQIQHTGGEFHLRSLYDLQRIFISVVYLQGTCSPEACWTLVAVGVRKLQDLGVHMRKRHHGEQANMTFTTIIEEELYKRTFWMFLCSDALISSFLGRPRIARDDECLDSLCRAEIHGAKLFSSYDIDYPLEVDDEFWEHPDPNKRFQQPEGKPSIYAFIVSYLKLTEILGTTQKTIYSVKRAQRSPGWSQSAVAELDSALNQWLDSIPDHLRWDPNREDEPFATQSACLYTGYYHVQIQIHRSFIPSPMNDAPLSSTFPSLAICANSARSCSRVMEAQARRGLIANPQAVSALMDCAIVILLNVWGAGRTGISVDPQRAANDVKKCIGVLKMYEVHWQVAGRYCDLLFTIGNQLINNPPAASTTTRKRGRSSQVSEPVPSPSQDAVQDPRNIAGSRRVSAAIQQQEDATSTINLNHFYPLPISTEELGHLPVYQSFDWGVPFGNDTLAFEPSSFAFNAQEQQYNSDLEFKSISAY